MTNTPTSANENSLPAYPAPANYNPAKALRPRFGRGPVIAGIVGGVLALGIVFGGGVLVGHFVVPSDAKVIQSQRGFNGIPGQNGQRPHFNGNQGQLPPGAAPDVDPGSGIAPTAAPAS